MVGPVRFPARSVARGAGRVAAHKYGYDAVRSVDPVGRARATGPGPRAKVRPVARGAETPYQEDLTMPGSWPCSAIWRKRTREVPVTRR